MFYSKLIKLFEPKVKGFSKARLNDLDSVREQMADRTAAVMLEPIQGGAGVILNAPRPGVLWFMPTLTVTGEEIDQMLNILEKVLSGFVLPARHGGR